MALTCLHVIVKCDLCWNVGAISASCCSWLICGNLKHLHHSIMVDLNLNIRKKQTRQITYTNHRISGIRLSCSGMIPETSAALDKTNAHAYNSKQFNVFKKMHTENALCILYTICISLDSIQCTLRTHACIAYTHVCRKTDYGPVFDHIKTTKD